MYIYIINNELSINRTGLTGLALTGIIYKRGSKTTVASNVKQEYSGIQ